MKGKTPQDIGLGNVKKDPIGEFRTSDLGTKYPASLYRKKSATLINRKAQTDYTTTQSYTTDEDMRQINNLVLKRPPAKVSSNTNRSFSFLSDRQTTTYLVDQCKSIQSNYQAKRHLTKAQTDSNLSFDRISDDLMMTT